MIAAASGGMLGQTSPSADRPSPSSTLGAATAPKVLKAKKNRMYRSLHYKYSSTFQSEFIGA
jgi:hypothetical protein